MAKKIIRIITTIILAIIVAALTVGIAMQAVAKFDFAMLPKLILPIIIVAIPAYALIYNYFYGKKRNKK